MTNGKTFDLLRHRRFLPLFIAQFLGAANDNLFKNAMAILIIYRIGDVVFAKANVLTNIGTGLFMLPFFLFSATAGELADRYEKSGLMKRVKFAEILVVSLGGLGLYTANVPILLVALFLLGAQATFFGPLKYAVLPEYLEPGELIGGNGLIEGGTFLAILIGTIVAGLLILTGHGIAAVTALMLALAISGFVAALCLPAAHGGDKTVRVRANLLAGTMDVLRTINRRREVFLSVLGISWFWAMGATFLTQFPAYAKEALGANEHVVTLMLGMFSIGIGAGSVLCARLLKGDISARHVPFAALGMAGFSLDLYFASRNLHPAGELVGLMGFIVQPHAWRILFDLAMIAGFGGIYTVPLYAIVQSRTEESERARAVAANNIANALFMVLAAAATAILIGTGLTTVHLFLIFAILNAVAAFYIRGLLPALDQIFDRSGAVPRPSPLRLLREVWSFVSYHPGPASTADLPNGQGHVVLVVPAFS